MSARFTAEEKAKAARREVGWRLKVYAKRVGDGSMTAQEAERQIAVMQEIAMDYEALAAKERLL